MLKNKEDLDIFQLHQVATYCSNLSKFDPDRQISEFLLHCDPIFENTPHNIKELLRNLNNNL